MEVHLLVMAPQFEGLQSATPKVTAMLAVVVVVCLSFSLIPEKNVHVVDDVLEAWTLDLRRYSKSRAESFFYFFSIRFEHCSTIIILFTYGCVHCTI